MVTRMCLGSISLAACILYPLQMAVADLRQAYDIQLNDSK